MLLYILAIYVLQGAVACFIHAANKSKFPTTIKGFVVMTFLPYAIFHLKEYKKILK